ncbi:MAG TPA: hypothetical protein VGV37_25885 [Aliidongia sp.]|uniref:hypothetical protein n=1 Tax=Aliidongia sp. TaxID=1914230 RepID=UPI002DDD8CAB|nr:hypothetical protein [Aliidongia sp.]HEV2677989.1 hypothetical protein [Aliidongia sp.]
MTEQPMVEQSATASAGYALHKSRLFVFVDVKEKASARQVVEGAPPFTLQRRFIGHDLAAVHSASFGNHPLIHPDQRDGKRLWQIVGAGESDTTRSGVSPAHRKTTGLAIADDLHPAVVAALGGHAGSGPGRRLSALQLTQAGLKLVNGQFARPPNHARDWSAADKDLFDPGRTGLSLALSPSAQGRLKTTATEILVTVVDVMAIFPSHFGLIIVELKVHAPGREQVEAGWIEEALHILSNRGRRASCLLATLKQPTSGSLTELIAAVIPSQHCHVPSWNRLYTYTVLVLNDFTGANADVDALAFRCARHYTKDYKLRREVVAASVQRPFDSVVHVFSLEGGASVVDGSDRFMGSQFVSRVEHLYLWLAALAYHEHIYLVDLVQKRVPIAAGSQSNSDRMTGIIGDFLEFRLRHRMPLVSDIEMHNEVYAGLRKALRLDTLSDKLGGDATAVERFNAQMAATNAEARRHAQLEKRKKSARGDALPSAVIIFGLTFLAFSSLAEKIEKLLMPDLAESWKNVVVLACASFFAVLGAILEFKRKRRDADKDPEEDDRLESGGDSDGGTTHEIKQAAAAGASSATH